MNATRRHLTALILLGTCLASTAGAQQQPAAAPVVTQAVASAVANGQSAMVLNPQDNSLIIRTTPRNHRRIADLIRKIAEGKLAGEKTETRTFSVLNLTPEQLFRILEFQQPTFQRSTTLVFPETADGQAAVAAGAR